MTEPGDKPRYHHGDLRAALLAAAEAELASSGVEGFSLRAVAKRAGVSHAAPAHHFGDAKGLLTALCAEGFRLFLASQQMREARAAPDPRSQLLAAGLGYIDFAEASPALFRLMFGSDKPRHDSPDLFQAGRAALGHLADQVVAAGGQVSQKDRISVDAAAVWAIAHGLAALIQSSQMAGIANLPPEQRDAALCAILARALPAPG